MPDHVQITLACRSIGGNFSEPLRADQHAALIVDCGRNGRGEHWIAQGGPRDGALRGDATQASSAGWYHDFSNARGAYWDRPSDQLRQLPVTIILQVQRLRDQISGTYLRAQAQALNAFLAGTPYNYENGPNSNSWVRLMMQRLGLSTSLPRHAPVLKAWSWQ